MHHEKNTPLRDTSLANRRKHAQGRFRKSKSPDFLEKLKNETPMVEYLTRLTVLNPSSGTDTPQRNGGYVRLAHAREEFPAPKLSKGKSVTRKRRSSKRANPTPKAMPAH